MSNVENLYDVVIIGSGPAGLSAAINSASEGFKTLMLEHSWFGGQSARSVKVENYYGFPTGIRGYELALKGRVQAKRLGAKVQCGVVNHLKKLQSGLFELWYEQDKQSTKIESKVVILACGLEARKLDCPGNDLPCVKYMPMPQEIDMYKGKPVAIVGGANSAGQAAIHAAENGSAVFLIVKGNSLDEMSEYLKARILVDKAIKIIYKQKIQSIQQVEDKTILELDCKCKLYVDGIFCFIGAKPSLDWLKNEVAETENGYVLVDKDYQTSLNGLFAIGDCHSNARSRIAASVGEGSIVVRSVFDYLENKSKIDKIVESLNYVADQHHLVFADVQGKDNQWSKFYAVGIMNEVRKLYGGKYNYTCLEKLLEQASKLYIEKMDKPEIWQRFYARFLDEQLREIENMCFAFAHSVDIPTPGGNYMEAEN